jgi:hypothetical protein
MVFEITDIETFGNQVHIIFNDWRNKGDNEWSW